MTKRAVLLTNLGSPDTAETRDVRKYLNQFLMDPHVIQLPWLFRRLIVSLFVLPSRPKTSAEAYRSIWQKEGSPLIFLSQQLKDNLKKELNIPVEIAMRYGKPSIENKILKLAKEQNVDEILLFPLYPHFAQSTVTTTIEEAKRVIKKNKLSVKLQIFKPFYDNPDYIQALVNSAAPYLNQPHDHILFSYHGLPELHITKMDKSKKHCLKVSDCCHAPNKVHAYCYRHQVFKTTEYFIKEANIKKQNYSVAFQSRLGRAKWLGPSTVDKLSELAAAGKKDVLVICPAFVTDCLETLEEIAIRAEEQFKEAGGNSLTLIPCLNNNQNWIKALGKWCNFEKMPDKFYPLKLD